MIRHTLAYGSAVIVTLLLPVVGHSGPADDNTISTSDIAHYLVTPVFDVLDCGAEGYVQAAEVDEHLGELHQRLPMTLAFHFTKLDLDDEPKRAELRKIDRHIKQQIDTNDDHIVSRIEYRIYMIDLLERIDADGDGEVTREDLATLN
ncbi:MAG: hypothetical protein AAFN07_12745 [Pseudomonadota bacterium]